MTYTVQKETQLLRFLLEDVPHLSRSKAKSLLKYGQISVNGRAVKAFDYPLRAGSAVTIGHGTKELASAASRLDILFENDELIVINKADGLLSVPSEGPEQETAYRLVTEYLQAKDSKSKAHIVHRLDQYTSGVLLFSKSKALKELLQADWNNLVSARKYYAVVEGILDPKEGSVTSWLSPKEGYHVRSSRIEREDAKKAMTEYRVLKETEGYSLLDVELKTGRKNQIRVHMRDLEHPVAGDKKYRAKTNPLHRLGLHAYLLELTHPVSGERFSFQSKLPKSFKRLFKEAAAHAIETVDP